MSGKRRYWRTAGALLAVGLLGCGCKAIPRSSEATTPAAAPSPSASPSSSPSSSPSPGSVGSSSYDPAHYAPQVREQAGRAGVSPRLLMAILYNEAYKPHDPELERAWQRLKPDSAFGIANMHRAAFDETKPGHFADRRWEELPDDPGLAVQAAAWYLNGLADQLPGKLSGSYTKDELLALGYNTGPGNMLAFARGARPGSQAQAYLDHLHANLPKADQALAAHG
ncbi:transglycosylase SLT domain-containing protein [Kitasatospora sp. McL0602]|uniref:transglycosylase SLT domain-containing protein n=1 Tax=Kitasatospora sp. McL0602 TaxID=3439530 RepID=UPI003F88DE68